MNAVGDTNGATWGENSVQETPGFAEAYRQYVDNGWASLAADEQYRPIFAGTALKPQAKYSAGDGAIL